MKRGEPSSLMHTWIEPTDEQLQTALSSPQAKTLQHKSRGGRSNARGNQYEALFRAAKVVELAATAKQPLTQLFVKPQVRGFVDDLAIAFPTQTLYYQCKCLTEAGQLSWTSGNPSLAQDFAWQHALVARCGAPPAATHLVVAGAALHAKMSQTMPGTLARHARVELFPYCEGIVNRLVYEYRPVRFWLSQISASCWPKHDELVALLQLVKAACAEFPDGATVAAILAAIDRHHPGHLRAPGPAEPWLDALDPALLTLLDNMEGLEYDVGRGFFQWRAFGTSGRFAFLCTDRRFLRFQQRVLQHQPRNFLALEELFP